MRDSNGQKPGVKTSEFWLAVATVLVSLAASFGWITGAETDSGILASGIAAAGYALGRGYTKG